MIIQCINCNKSFEVNSELIPDSGRNIQCGSCNHVWFFTKNQQYNQINNKKVKTEKKISSEEDKATVKKTLKTKKINNKFLKKNSGSTKDYKKSALIKYEETSKFRFSNFLSYILVAVISFISLIIILDTFKTPLYSYFPNLEFVLFNLFETITDINLFIKDLI